MTALDAYKEAVHSVPCVICLHKLGQKVYGVESHHAGSASDRNDFAQIALCAEHHRGATGVHGARRGAFHRLWKVTDFQLIGWTNELIFKQR